MPRAVNEEMLLESIRELAEELDNRPTTGDMNKYGNHSAITYYDYFDSWTEALEKANVDREREKESVDHSDHEWTNEDRLRELYVDQQMSTYDIAKLKGTTSSVVNKYLKKHGIERRSTRNNDQRLNSESWMREKYHNEGKTMPEIADIIGVDNTTVLKRFREFGIEARERLYHNKIPPRVHTNTRGYEEICNVHKGTEKTVQHHQLLAIADGADPHNVFSDNIIVHHDINIPWLNYKENLEVMTISDHIKLHAERGDF